MLAFSAVSTNQCRLLEGVLGTVQQWVRYDGDLPEHFVGDMLGIMETGAQLIDGCRTGDKLPFSWLRTAVLREERKEEFSLVLERLSDALRSLIVIDRYSSRKIIDSLSIPQAKLLLDRIRSVKLVHAAAKDRTALMALLENVIRGASSHQKDVKDVARFLLGILKADNFNAWKKACQVNRADIANGKPLGSGAYGYVFEATWKGLVIAVKQNTLCPFPEEVSAEEFKELAALFTARHENVVRIFGCSSDQWPSLLLLERMDCNLDSIIAKEGAFPLRISIDILLQVARGMAYLHKNSIVHRDLKPTNILLQGDLHNWIVKIADFGTSRTQFDHTTLATAHVGTRAYMAPEIMREDNVKVSYGLKVDTYSFGMVCYRVLTGCELNLRPEAILKGHRPEIRALSNCPEALISLIMQCWHEDPHKRPPFSEVYDILVLIKYRELIKTSSKDFVVRTLPRVPEVPRDIVVRTLPGVPRLALRPEDGEKRLFATFITIILLICFLKWSFVLSLLQYS